MGSTPTVRLRSVRPEGGAEIWLKLEHLNPSGSVEDRVAAALVDAAPDPLALAGTPDRAIAVALAARVRGRSCAVALTRPPTHEQREMLQLLGAEIRESAPEADATAAFRASLGAEVAAWLKALPARPALIVAPGELAPALDGAGVPVLPAPAVPAREAAAMASRLAREEGLLVGPRTGASVAAAYQAARARAPGEVVLAFALESGERYFSAAMEPQS
ncbi:MAG TPA: pyridoxal-phosphate dependent enzyme [Myxococcales bacterium]|nr:pyridoxal-phosphate dependent enzyme [Myxococcales bacterium]